jgi:sugar fermentation stimulation protein A
MKFPKALEKTMLVKRYKRFLADVTHPEIGEMTVHCPNTGSMKNCWQQGWTAWILDSGNSKRKYLYTWVLAENEKGEFIGINTHYANEVVIEAIAKKEISELANFSEIKKEIKYGDENSRVDILLIDRNKNKTYIEVKSVTLLDNDLKGYEKGSGKGCFPDAVTTRGQKHLRELMHCVKQGHRAVLFFLVQHTGIKSVTAAKHIDPEYAALLNQAVEAGVEVVAYGCLLSESEIVLNKKLPFYL